jgi:tetratricopeptide (TPR) repeat protein
MSTYRWSSRSGPAGDEEIDIEVDCHRRLRGPYTGLGSLMRALVPTVYARWPELVRKHSIEILSVAPELRGKIDAPPETLTSLAVPTERTRIYPANRTRRHAHGAIEFLRSYVDLAGLRSLTLSFRNVDEADHTDQEFLAIALRRWHGGPVGFDVCARSDNVPEELASALDRYARPVPAREPAAPENNRGPAELLRAYIDSDGTSDDPAELAAYRDADAATRAELHDLRAAELIRQGEWSLHLGAIPYHLEHGADPTQAGGKALLDAADYCFEMGFYRMQLDYGPRGLAVTDPDTEQERYWLLSTKISTALSLIGRSAEAEPIYFDLRSRYAMPKMHIFCGYALAMLFTRHHPPEFRDHRLAKVYLNNTIAMASLLPDPQERAFFTVFQQNGLALVEMHLGNLPAALRLVGEGLDRLDSELAVDQHRLHRSVLVNNRAKVYAALGRLDEALADASTVIELDPNYPDYYFDRADVRRKLGDLAGAISDYDAAIPLTPPFYELHYNRGDLRAEVGDLAGAIADFRYVVVLEPDQIDARVNLVSLLLETGGHADARAHLDEGLLLHPDDARLLHLRGLLALEQGDPAAARRDFNRALAADARLVPALASRAALAHDSGDLDTATADLTAAIDQDATNPDLLYNRGFVHQSAGRWGAAVQDYSRALALPGADRAELLRQRAHCHAQLGEAAASHADREAVEALSREYDLTGAR